MNEPKQVLILDDLPGARLLLSAAVAKVLPGAQIHEAASIADVRALLSLKYSLALIDLSLPDGRGATIIRALKSINSDIMVAAVTVMDDDASIEEALAAGADGYLLKDAEPSLLAHRIERLVAGEPSLSPVIARRVLARFASPPTSSEPDEDNLSGREREVLSLVGRGMRTNEVATLLKISPHTVRDHLKNIYRKLDVSSRAEVAVEAHRRNLT